MNALSPNLTCSFTAEASLWRLFCFGVIASVDCTVLHHAALCCTALCCTTLCCTAMHCAALHCAALHCAALHCTVLHWTVLHCTVLHCTAALHCCTALHLMEFTVYFSTTFSLLNLDNVHKYFWFLSPKKQLRCFYWWLKLPWKKIPHTGDIKSLDRCG